MIEHPENKNSSPDGQLPQRGKSVLNTKLLSQAIIELNIALKNALIFPPNHTQVKSSSNRVFATICQVLEFEHEITFGIAKDTIIAGQEYFDPKNPVYRNLSLFLKQHDIAAVTFVKGIDSKELSLFLYLIVSAPKDIRSAGGIETVAHKSNLPHIKIMEIDYSKLNVTEEKEILRPQASDNQPTDRRLWFDFISNMISGTLPNSGGNSFFDEGIEIDPVEIANLINKHHLDGDTAIQSYEKIINNYLIEMDMKNPTSQGDPQTLTNLNTLIKELNPEIRKQFLLTTISQCSSSNKATGAEVFVSGLSDNLVIEMLRLVNEEGQEISPTLMNFIGKITHTMDSIPDGDAIKSAVPSDRESPTDVKPDKLENLLKRENYEKFIIPEYDSVLKKLTKDQTPEREEEDATFSIKGHLNTLEDSSLDLKIARALLAFMDIDIEEDEYSDFMGRLLDVVDALPELGDFSLLSDIFDALRRHRDEKKCTGIRSKADEAVKKFRDPAFIKRCVAAFGQLADTTDLKPFYFLVAIGPKVVPEAVSHFCKQENPETEVPLLILLSYFKKEAVDCVLKRLHDLNVPSASHLMILLRRLDAEEAAPQLKLLLENQDSNVAIDVIETLLEFKEPSAYPLLTTSLHSKDPDIVAKAISLAGKYHVSQVVPDLIAMIKKSFIVKSTYQENETIISALGQIGDPAAIPALEKLARSSWTLYPEHLSQMKVTLFHSLAGYPHGSIRNLLKIGIQSRNAEIKKTCKRMFTGHP